MNQIHTYKRTENRGNARIWIEGTRLSDSRISRGMVYAKRWTQTPNGPRLILDFAPLDGEKTAKVAGTANRPIIDICSAAVTRFMADATHYKARFADGADLASNAPVIVVWPVAESVA